MSAWYDAGPGEAGERGAGEGSGHVLYGNWEGMLSATDRRVATGVSRVYLMYVDESGDPGLPTDGSPSRRFCLRGLVVHELRWSSALAELTEFRHRMKARYGVYLDEELHVADLLSKPSRLPSGLARLSKHERLAILRHHADAIADLRDVRLVNGCLDKRLTQRKTARGRDSRTRSAETTFRDRKTEMIAVSSSPTARMPSA